MLRGFSLRIFSARRNHYEAERDLGRRCERRRLLGVRFERGEHDVRPCKQLRNRGRGVREAIRIDHGGLWRPDDADHGGHAVWFDQFDRELIMVDLSGG